MERNKRIDLLISGILFVTISILTFIGIYGSPFFWDYTIIFDGGYRIFLGLHPFTDFSIPYIPIPFYLQAFFDFIFGPNLIAMAFYSIFLSTILSIMFYFISKKYFSRSISFLLSVAFHYSFIGMSSFPWYNQIAFFFFSLNFFLIYWNIEKKEKSNKIFLFSFILTLLTFFSKLEIGAIHFVLNSFYFLIFEGKIKKVFTNYILPEIASLFIIIELMANHSLKSFSLTKELFINKISETFSLYHINNIVYSFCTYLLLFIIYLAINYKEKISELDPILKKKIALLIMLNLFLTLVLLFTGTTQEHLFAIPLNLLLIYIILKDFFQRKKIKIKIKIIKIAAIFLIIVIILLHFSVVSNRSEERFVDPLNQLYNLLFAEKTGKYFKEDFGCYKGILYREDTYLALKKIREKIQNTEGNIVILGEFSFLYCDYKKVPPLKLPLWAHEGVTFEKEKGFGEFKNYFEINKPSLIIEQYLGPNESRNELKEHFISLGYVKTEELKSTNGFTIRIYELQV